MSVALGWWLSDIGQRRRDRQEQARRRYSEVVELYVPWILGLREALRNWTSEHTSTPDLSVISLKLDILDAEGRALRLAVWATLPDPYSKEYQAMEFEQHTETPHEPFSWPEFDVAMAKVIEHVRALNPDRRRARSGTFM